METIPICSNIVAALGKLRLREMAMKEAEKAINIAMPRKRRERGGSTWGTEERRLKRSTTSAMVAEKARIRIVFPMSCSWNMDDDDRVGLL